MQILSQNKKGQKTFNIQKYKGIEGKKRLFGKEKNKKSSHYATSVLNETF